MLESDNDCLSDYALITNHSGSIGSSFLKSILILALLPAIFYSAYIVRACDYSKFQQ